MGLQDYIRATRARPWIVLLTTVIVAAVSVVVSYLQAPIYQGEASVLLTQQNAASTILGSPQPQISNQPDRDVMTQVGVIRSPGILQQVIRTLNLRTTPAELLNHVNVSTDGQTDIVTIEVKDGSMVRPAAIANTLAQTYVRWSQDRERASIESAANDVESRLAAAQQQIVSAQASLLKGDPSGAKQVGLEAANSLYRTLADQLEQLKINAQLVTGSGSILSSATPNPVPVSPKPARDGVLGLAMGLVLGIGMAFVAKTLDNTIKSSDVAEEALGAPVLGNIPIEKRAQQDGHHLMIVERPGGPGAEAYRVLRNNLEFINFERDIKTVLITSAAPSEGKSTVAANLAAALSQAGKKVVLLCCDFRRPVTSMFFDIDGQIGLSDVLANKHKVEKVLQQPKGLESLWVVSAGQMPPNPSELLGSPKMQQLVTGMRERVDWVILDSAPLLAVADAAAVARWVDGVLIVVRAGVSTREEARKSREQLENVGARILGVVLSGVDEAAPRGGYFQGYDLPPTE